jgi:metal-sulfur cluster biosynthetic enzyme
MDRMMSKLPEIPTKEAILNLLHNIIDPEVGINIVDLGLIYGVEISDNKLRVDLTMTTQACPMGDMILDDVRQALTGLAPTGTEININLVWEPPWSPDKMSQNARDHFGWEQM